MAVGGHDDIDEQLVGVVLFQSDMHAVLGNIGLACLHGLAVTVAKNLQLQFGSSDERSQGNGDGKSHHAGARDAHAHSVFQDVCTQAQLNVLGLLA